jgi:hypothetical protein
MRAQGSDRGVATFGGGAPMNPNSRPQWLERAKQHDMEDFQRRQRQQQQQITSTTSDANGSGPMTLKMRYEASKQQQQQQQQQQPGQGQLGQQQRQRSVGFAETEKEKDDRLQQWGSSRSLGHFATTTEASRGAHGDAKFHAYAGERGAFPKGSGMAPKPHMNFQHHMWTEEMHEML